MELAGCERFKLPDGATQVKSEDNNAVIYVEDANNIGNVINDIARNNNIRNIYTEKPQIEDIILKIYKNVLIPIHSKNRKTGYYQQKIYYSDNFEVWHQCSKLPFLEYHDFCDSQLYSVDNELGLLMREKSVNNWDMFCSKSNDDGITWNRPLKVPFKGCSRPKIEIYQNKLIVFFSFDKLENMKLNNKVVIAISNFNEFHKTPYRCNFSTYSYTDLYGDQNCELCLGNAGCIHSETGNIITTTYFVKNNIGNIAVNILKGSGFA